jgi:alcohol dehydrogenase
MQNEVYNNPTRVYFGKGVIAELPALLKENVKKKALLVYGSKYLKESGLYAQITDAFKKAGVAFSELPGVLPNPRLSSVHEGVRICKAEGIDFVLAAGGGSVIDASKAIALGALYDGDVWDAYMRKADPGKALPVATILTIPGAGSESSTGTVVTKEEGQVKSAFNGAYLRPVWSLLDPEWTYTLNPYLTAAGATDAFAHCLERYFTNTQDVYLTDRLLESVMETLAHFAPVAIKEPNNYDARAQVMWACKVCHDDSLSTGRTQDWGSHMIEHELSGIYDVAHGAGLAVIFPAWMQYVYKHDVKRFAQYAHRVFGVPVDMDEEAMALEGIEQTKAFFRRIGMPVTLKELGTGSDRIAEMARKCCASPHNTVGNFVKLHDKDVLAIYKLAE